MKILLVDNRDSFVYNVVGLLCSCGLERGDVDVVRSDEIPYERIGEYSGVVLSPGPGLPEESAGLMRFIAEAGERMPLLGICLGHQAIAQHWGAKLQRRECPRHGHPSELQIIEEDDPLLKGISESGHARIGRYHSWEVSRESVEWPLKVTSVSGDDGSVMSIRHMERPLYGLQFHPESIITDCGQQLMCNFLSLCHSIRNDSL